MLAQNLFITLLFTSSFAADLLPYKKRSIIAGTYNQQLLTFTFDGQNLELAKTTKLDKPVNAAPSWLERQVGIAQRAQHRFLVTDESGAGRIQVVEKSGQNLKVVADTSSGGNGPAFVGHSKDGKWAIAANYGDGTVLPIPLKTDGTFAASSQPVLNYNNTGVTSHPHQAVELPNGNFIIVDLGRDQLHEIALGVDRKWRTVGETDISPKGSGPRHGVLRKDGSVFYLLTEEANEIQIFKVKYNKNKASNFSHVSSTSILPPNAKPYDGFILGAGELLKTKDERFLYASNRNENTTLGDAIAIFEITSPTTIKSRGFARSGGQHIRGMKLDPIDSHLIAANQISGSTVVYKRDFVKGGLTLVDSVATPNISVTDLLWDP